MSDSKSLFLAAPVSLLHPAQCCEPMGFAYHALSTRDSLARVPVWVLPQAGPHTLSRVSRSVQAVASSAQLDGANDRDSWVRCNREFQDGLGVSFRRPSPGGALHVRGVGLVQTASLYSVRPSMPSCAPRAPGRDGPLGETPTTPTRPACSTDKKNQVLVGNSVKRFNTQITPVQSDRRQRFY